MEEWTLRQKIDAIFSEINNLKSRIEGLEPMRDKIRKIGDMAREVETSMDELHREVINRIEIIMG